MHSVLATFFFHLGNRLKKVTFLKIKSKGGMTTTFSFLSSFSTAEQLIQEENSCLF